MSRKVTKNVLVTTLLARHPVGVFARITPEALIERLVAFHQASGPDDLYGRIPNSTRTLKRWKAEGWPQNVSDALEMLEAAGYLVTDEPTVSEMNQARARKVARRLADDAEQLLALL